MNYREKLAGHLDSNWKGCKQAGHEPKNWKPLSSLGKGITGVREIRVEIDTNIYRSAYVTKFGDSIVVLHC